MLLNTNLPVSIYSLDGTNAKKFCCAHCDVPGWGSPNLISACCYVSNTNLHINAYLWYLHSPWIRAEAAITRWQWQWQHMTETHHFNIHMQCGLHIFLSCWFGKCPRLPFVWWISIKTHSHCVGARLRSETVDNKGLLLWELPQIPIHCLW